MTRSQTSRADLIDVLDAYRADQDKRSGEPFGASDGAWLQLGQHLHHAALLPETERARHLAAAATIARELLGDEQWRAGYRTDPEPPRNETTLASRIRIIADVTEDAGALRLTDAMLAAFAAADVSASALELGRIEAVRARLAWKAGEIELATERYRRTLAAAREINSVELRVRAQIGQATLNRIVGNHPHARLLARRAAKAAERASLLRLAGLAHNELMIAAGVRAHFDEAMMHGWRAFTLAAGDEDLESHILSNVGQLFLVAGHPETALAAFRAVVTRQGPDRILLPGLGGIALAAARLGERETVFASETEFMRHAAIGSPTYDVAATFLELANARNRLGDSRTAERHRKRSLEIAARYGYHEIVHHAATPFESILPVKRTLSPQAEQVASAIRQLSRV